jgi:CubicO group peptidase (beta-lactamase class C family)
MMLRSCASLLLLFLAFSGSTWAAPVGGDAVFQRAANAAITRIAQADGFSGAVLLARGDKILLRQAKGFADRDRKIVNQVDTHFPLASITKQFTAAAILLLVEEGKVSLNDPISKYAASLPKAWMGITIRQLLNHSGGIVDCGPCGSGDYTDSYRAYIDRSMAAPLAFPPGSGMLYSNAGYGLLAVVIERVTGQSYGAFVKARIFDPLHMIHSGYGTLPANSAKGYIHNVGETAWHEDKGAPIEAMAGFGGLYTTVDDMLIWARAIRGNALLAPASRAAMFTDYGHNYGFGWRFSDKLGHKLVWHTGTNAGYATMEDIFPDEDLVLIILFNNTGLTKTKATLTVEGKPVTFPANAGRELAEELESLYFTGKKPI